jgi:hypothetical protein
MKMRKSVNEFFLAQAETISFRARSLDERNLNSRVRIASA